MNTPEILTALGVIISAIGGGTWLGSIIAKPKTDAEAKKINAEVIVTFAEGWKNYAEKLEKRLTALDEKYTQLEEQRSRDLQEYQRQILIKDEEHRASIAKKDEEISALNKRIDDLEYELARYREVELKPLK